MNGRTILITGGCGFIGSNLADAAAERGEQVLIIDSLARPGVRENAHWLKNRHGRRIEIKVGDVRHGASVNAAVARADAVLHLAGQVAVTSSLDRPLEDFEINARGTLNVLEAARLHNPRVPIIFASTNKVYGRLLKDGDYERAGSRYVPRNPHFARGVGEDTPLDPHSPYGCSKGAADQYVNDYARVFGLRTAALRMSCIYGPRQLGTEDQGWIAHFMIQAIRRKPVTIYGDGLQVRDALHVSDAVAAWLGLLDKIDGARGPIFNLGGGPENATSLLELLEAIASLRGDQVDIVFDRWRPGDQPWYVSNTAALRTAIGWRPHVRLSDGLRTLEAWLTPRVTAEHARQGVSV